jgi:very-short-patch-repair endonuclease
VPATDRPSGKPKNLIFASSEKPDIRLGNAISNDIEIVSNADKVLVYDRHIDHKGLTWQQLQDWWGDTNELDNDDQAKRSLYSRLLQSLPKNSPPQRNFFTYYGETFKEKIPSLPALLPEVWLHWDAKTVRERGVDALPRSRMDFLLLLPNDVRVVIEIDGKEHYANGDLACPEKYSEMVSEDRLLKLGGYQVFRFGGYELNQKNAIEMVKDFWIRLYQKFGIIPKT